MDLNIDEELESLQSLATSELRERYAEAWNEEPRSRNRPSLIRRIIWRMQANAEGDLSERARRRAEELADDAETRVTPPRKIGPRKEVLAENRLVRIERIVSTGHASPEGFWYDQDEAEWVVVLKGEAKLVVEGEHEPIGMRPGDHVLIPAHRKHRVEWTTPDEPTVWLAVFCEDEGSKGKR